MQIKMPVGNKPGRHFDKRSRMSNKVRILIIVVALAGMITAAVMVVTTYIEYRKAEEEYSQLESFVGTAEGQTDGVSDQSTEPEEETREFKRNYNRNDFPDMEIDYDGLYKKNRDYIGWLYVSSVNISYPVVQGTDNEYYLHNTFEHKPNFAGCIFIDCQDKADLTMFNTFVYGHAMKNGTMFGNLRKLRRDPSLVKNDPYIYMFMRDGIYRYQIYSYYIDEKESVMYHSAQNLKEYRQYFREAMDRSMADCEAKPNEENNSITLVTCSGTGAQKQRFFVHGIFVDRYLY
ncbi:MAG: class B sortase [Lachnospiraceae bacterium]|nr:class B sortase [Lachnospiraceae bacterium]